MILLLLFACGVSLKSCRLLFIKTRLVEASVDFIHTPVVLTDHRSVRSCSLWLIPENPTRWCLTWFLSCLSVCGQSWRGQHHGITVSFCPLRSLFVPSGLTLQSLNVQISPPTPPAEKDCSVCNFTGHHYLSKAHQTIAPPACCWRME